MQDAGKITVQIGSRNDCARYYAPLLFNYNYGNGNLLILDYEGRASDFALHALLSTSRSFQNDIILNCNSKKAFNPKLFANASAYIIHKTANIITPEKDDGFHYIFIEAQRGVSESSYSVIDMERCTYERCEYK